MSSKVVRSRSQARKSILRGATPLVGVVPSGGLALLHFPQGRKDRNSLLVGVVPSGGLALPRCIDALQAKVAQAEGDQCTGRFILKRAREAPSLPPPSPAEPPMR